MPFSKEFQEEVFIYCNNHLPGENWYACEFEFIENESFRKRLVEEYKGIRFAYKLYEGIEAKDENLIFEVRHQILSYASIYEAVIHYVLYNYYQDTQEFHDMQYHQAPAKISIPKSQMSQLKQLLTHNGEDLMIYHMQERKKDESQVRFDEKCITAKKLGLLKNFTSKNGENVDLSSEIIEIYGYRNAIHLVAEQRKGIEYEIELSKKAYRRMRPFINQIKEGLQRDHKGVYA